MRPYLLCKCLHGGDVDTATFRVMEQHPQNRKFSTDCLSTASGGSHKHIVITVVHCIEHWKKTELKWIQNENAPFSSIQDAQHCPVDCTLCLNWVEEGELVLVEGFKGRVPESSDRKRLQVKQLCGWGVLLREDKVTEWHWKLGLTSWNNHKYINSRGYWKSLPRQHKAESL